MNLDAEHSELRVIPVSSIDPSPENPRIVFRPGELEKLQESIATHGVQVPISVYKSGRRYVLIDGERRWRCCLKLNKKEIPALVHGKPDAVTNLLLMFNVHMLREEWDLLTLALKLPRLIDLLTEQIGHPPSESELSEKSGLSRSEIRRCKLLIDLPSRYRKVILDELKKPKRAQKLTEDFFIEMERSLRTVERQMPDALENKDDARDILIEKYEKGIISNITEFRDLARIARADRVDAPREVAADALTKVLSDKQYSIRDAFEQSVSSAYAEKSLISKIQSLLRDLEYMGADEIDEHVRGALLVLIEKVRALLRRADDAEG